MTGKLARQDVTLGTLTHTTTSVRDASGQTLRTQYLPVQLDFGTLAAPLQYTAGNKLFSASGFITSTLYEADGQTKEITYANGVKTSFTYSPTRRWLTRVTTARGATVPMPQPCGFTTSAGLISSRSRVRRNSCISLPASCESALAISAMWRASSLRRSTSRSRNCAMACEPLVS